MERRYVKSIVPRQTGTEILLPAFFFEHVNVSTSMLETVLTWTTYYLGLRLLHQAASIDIYFVSVT